MNYYLDLNDERLNYVKNILEQSGHTTYNYWGNENKISTGDIVILSPALKLDNNQASALPFSCIIFASHQREDVMESLKQCIFCDYADDEEYAMQGAMLTAENFLPIMIENTSQSIYDEKILIIGGGRIAKSLWSLFSKMGVTFSATMRNVKQLSDSMLFTSSYFPLDDLRDKLSNYSIVINTVPATLFDSNSTFSAGCVLFELSSIPCVSGSRVGVVPCRALPSKFAPITAGKLLFNSIEKRIKKINY